jgi:Spy/CpxP family protein refolding chaperone
MKKTIFAAFIILGASAYAQKPVKLAKPAKAENQVQNQNQKPSPEERAKRVTQKLEKELGLTADQKQKVSDLTLTRIKEGEKLRELRKTDKNAAKGKFKALTQQYHADMKGILTAEQHAKWEAKKQEMIEKKKQKLQQGKNPMQSDDENDDSDLMDN